MTIFAHARPLRQVARLVLDADSVITLMVGTEFCATLTEVARIADRAPIAQITRRRKSRGSAGGGRRSFGVKRPPPAERSLLPRKTPQFAAFQAALPAFPLLSR